jgi:hypothetical protein
LLSRAAQYKTIAVGDRMNGGMQTILTDPLAITAIGAVLFVSLAPLISGLVRRRRKRLHRAEFRELPFRQRLIADYEAASRGLTGESLRRRTEQFLEALPEREADVLKKYLVRNKGRS